MEEVEKKVYVDNGEMPHTIVDLKKKVEHFKEKLEVSSMFKMFAKPV